ncbi:MULTISPECIES: SCO family protein [Deinococcus]|jgi:protein SCO1/2|uniref:Protein SCO1/2 n=5 Tax=Deinococcus TaxID=1298 RepID=A0AAE4BQR5_9DEIO|nr:MULTISPECIES: SCO family protein [Deinococcus]MCD0159844.1 SCO family protein [Deinococcus sp. 6YEL10]MCD0164080.1 SCO family protein [Deinococcus sp. 12RED42]MCD0174635.1 SCO family protein [Deinococcus sp. 14RED07]MDK2013696.1 SCO family protein [Deinococcus sp. 43]MDR6221001.1 protein SCO1/2 [Deinococcus soli (ex Cha et al. 2016)]
MTSDSIPLSQASRPWLRSLTLALLAVAALLSLTLLYSRLRNPQGLLGTAYPPGTVAPPLAGTGDDGRPLALADFKGKTVAVFFGFLNCPNICPTTLAALERVRQTLPERRRKDFVSLLVTVDPGRDTPAELRSYVRYFSPDARGLVIPKVPLRQAAAAWGVGFEYSNITAPDRYEVNHTTGVYLVDREGNRRVVWDYTQLNLTDRIATDVRTVMQ